MATASGTVKKTALTEFSRPRSAGIIAVNLNAGGGHKDVNALFVLADRQDSGDTLIGFQRQQVETALTEFSRPRSAGIIAVNLNEGDELIGVDLTSGVVFRQLNAAYAGGGTAHGANGIFFEAHDLAGRRELADYSARRRRDPDGDAKRLR
jgi:DNA gyrase/topoisomerase IV subunit A